MAREPSTDWPRWRGPSADGVADGRSLPIRWSETENIRWSVELPGWGTSSPVVYGVLVCLDGKTGDELYRERLGGSCNSSPVARDGRIYLSDNDGRTFVVKAGKKFTLLETNLLPERISASPAITGNWLIYRTDSHLYCIGGT